MDKLISEIIEKCNDYHNKTFKLKLNVPLPDLLKGPRAKIVLAEATTPVPTKFSLSFFAE